MQSLTPAATDQKLALLREAAGAFDDLELQMLVGFLQVGDDSTPIMQGVASVFGVSEEEARMAPVILVGSTTEMVENVARRRRTLADLLHRRNGRVR